MQTLPTLPTLPSQPNLPTLQAAVRSKSTQKARAQPDYLRTVVPKSNLTVRDVLDLNARKQKWGISGYKMPKSKSQINKEPNYSFPKDKCRSFLDKLQKSQKTLPAPTSYNCHTVKWVRGNQQILKKGAKRKTIIDQVVQRESKTPGPNAYFKAPAKLKGNSPLPKSDRINFLCDAEYLGKTAPGPTDYKPNHQVHRKSCPKFKYASLKNKNTEWKPKKSDAPGPASYTPQKVALKKNPSTLILKGKQKTFTQAKMKQSQIVPGVGKYDIVPAYKRISTGAPKTHRTTTINIF